MDSWLVLRRNRVILNKWTKRNDRSFEWFPKTSLVWSFPIRQEILNVSQIGTAFHQFSSRPDCNNTAEVPSFTLRTDPICFWSMWCRRAMIPGEIFTSFAEFQGIVSVNDFRLPIGLQELLQASLGFLWSFCFCTDTTGSIGWPSPAPRLHIDDCFEIHNLHWELCDLL